ncbi:P27 family phage terminase small subunit [Acidithiobacillus sulfuriphilus]|uniref:P27 family phage terminase small subunit n=1 Tax=Acidithiobacillus sulfuriphilus TaxID=1867749 RepID=UPI003F62C548
MYTIFSHYALFLNQHSLPVLRRSPLMDVIRDLAQEMKGYESEMGFTPASRSRVQIAQNARRSDDPWAGTAG